MNIDNWVGGIRNYYCLLLLLNYEQKQIQASAKVLASGRYTEKFQVIKPYMIKFSNMEIFLKKYIFPIISSPNLSVWLSVQIELPFSVDQFGYIRAFNKSEILSSRNFLMDLCGIWRKRNWFGYFNADAKVSLKKLSYFVQRACISRKQWNLSKSSWFFCFASVINCLIKYEFLKNIECFYYT